MWRDTLPRGRDTTKQATVDHILPHSEGGPNTQENIRVVCQLCNESLAKTNHCVAALVCVREVMGQSRPHVRDVHAAWTLWGGAALTRRARRALAFSTGLAARRPGAAASPAS